MNRRVLFVDDEVRVLQAIRRTLHKEFEIETAESGSEALATIDADGPFAVVVSDMQMPEMNGLQLLAEIKARCPDTVRLMLTGNNDQETAVAAVNEGEVFRFLNKPCNADGLRAALKMALKQYQLVTAERELLEETLRGSIRVLGEILSITKPEMFGAMSRIRHRVSELCEQLQITDTWQIDTAAMLCHLGCVSQPDETMRKWRTGDSLTQDEKKSFAGHPLLGAELLANIPRLEQVSNIVLYQNKNYDGSGFPRDNRKEEDIPLGARIIKVVMDVDRLLQGKWSESGALEELKKRSGTYDPEILEALAASIAGSEAKCTKRVTVSSLRDGMIIEEDICTAQGLLLVCSGQAVTPAIRQHLTKFAAAGSLASPILVSDGGEDSVAAA